MKNYVAQYPIIDRRKMVPREEITLVPGSQLSPLDRAELIRLREGKVAYSVLVADTPENRQNIGVKTAYFQIVAYKEGWEFDPKKYQVEFVDPNHFLLAEEGTQKRIYQFSEDGKSHCLGGVIGFTVTGEQAERMRDEEASGLARRILNFFK